MTAFPHKNPGDKLSAAHVNAINRECRKIAARSIPWNQDLPPWHQHIVEVVEVVNKNVGWYNVRPRYYSYLETPPKWRTQGSSEHDSWNMDISGLFKNAAAMPHLRIGDVGVAYWDAQRNTFIPVHIGTPELVLFELSEDRTWDDEQSDAQLVKWNGAAYVRVTPLADNDMIVVAPCGKWVGKVGYRGWARVAENRLSQADEQVSQYPGTTTTTDAGKPIFEIVYLEAPARWLRFKLAADPEPGPADGALFTAEIESRGDGDFWGAAPNHKVPEMADNEETANARIVVHDYDNHLKRALKGANGWAVYYEGTDEWIVQQCETKASFIRFTLTTALTTGGSSGSESEAGNATVNDYWGEEADDVLDPGKKVKVTDPLNGFAGSPAGSRGLAVYDWDNDWYVIIICEGHASHISFTLTENFYRESTSGSATRYEARATIDARWGTNGWEIRTPGTGTPATFRIYDYQKLFKYGLKGAKGIAVYDWNNEKFVAIACQQRTMTLRGTLGMAMSTSAGPWLVQSLIAMDHTPFNQLPARDDGTPEDGIRAYNVFGFEADASAVCMCKWNETSERWEIFQVMCPA